MSIINYDDFPHIVERIFEHAAQDSDTLIALRGMSKQLMSGYEEGLWTHVAVGMRFRMTASGPEVFPALYAPTIRSDGSPIRLPLDIDFARNGLDPTRPTDEETVQVWRAMKRARDKLMDTETVDWWAQAGEQTDEGSIGLFEIAALPGGDSSL